jgi:Kef-type K+ transport system membrane component KefB
VLVLMLFVIVGSVGSVEVVQAGGIAAVVLLTARALAKTGVVFALAPWSGIGWRQAAGLSLALTPMSGTALVLLSDLQGTHPGFAPQVAPVVLAAIVYTAVLGPLAVQWGLRLAGEHQPAPPVLRGVPA